MERQVVQLRSQNKQLAEDMQEASNQLANQVCCCDMCDRCAAGRVLCYLWFVLRLMLSYACVL